MTPSTQAELARLQRNILENHANIASWRLLFQQHSSSKDAKSILVAVVVSRLSRADVENKTNRRPANVLEREIKVITKNSTAAAQEPEINEDEYSLEQELQKAHVLADTGAFNESKKILLKLTKTETHHIKAWAQYLIAK